MIGGSCGDHVIVPAVMVIICITEIISVIIVIVFMLITEISTNAQITWTEFFWIGLLVS